MRKHIRNSKVEDYEYYVIPLPPSEIRGRVVLALEDRRFELALQEAASAGKDW